jgi:hypothetical protein
VSSSAQHWSMVSEYSGEGVVESMSSHDTGRPGPRLGP